jgi:hypothetical protein
MTRKSLLLLSALLFCSALGLRGQSVSFIITGTVIDSADGTPLAMATVFAQDLKDSVVIADVVTDTKGHFIMRDIPTDREKIGLGITLIGYASYYRIIHTPKATSVDLGHIFLTRNSKGRTPSLKARRPPH